MTALAPVAPAPVHAPPPSEEDAESVARLWQCAGNDLAALTEIAAKHPAELVRKYARACLSDILDDLHRALGREAHR